MPGLSITACHSTSFCCSHKKFIFYLFFIFLRVAPCFSDTPEPKFRASDLRGSEIWHYSTGQSSGYDQNGRMEPHISVAKRDGGLPRFATFLFTVAVSNRLVKVENLVSPLVLFVRRPQGGIPCSHMRPS